MRQKCLPGDPAFITFTPKIKKDISGSQTTQKNVKIALTQLSK